MDVRGFGYPGSGEQLVLKITTLVEAALLTLALAACQGQPRPQATVEPPRSVGRAAGIDLPTDASDVLNELKDGRIAFVARYYRDPMSRWPALSASEAQRLSSLGLRIVAVWEPYRPDPVYFSYATGYNDALRAHRQAKAVGQPAGSAIYFAIDFDARGQALSAVDQYFRGVRAGIAASGGGRPEYKIGVYGSGAVCYQVRQTGLAEYSWLSNSPAWAGARGYNAWNIRQGSRYAHLTFNHDADEARDDYGGFQLAGAGIAAAPAPALAAAPKAPGFPWLMSAIQPSP